MELLSREAFDKEWIVLRPVVLQFACRLTNPDDAEDLTQDAYLTALAILHHYDAATQAHGLTRWLTTITRHLYCNLQRQETGRASRLSTHARNQPQEPEDDQAAQLCSAIDDSNIIASLTGRRLEIWQLFRKGLTQARIAAALGITQQAVSYHVTRIIDELRASAGHIITRADGYADAEALFRAMSRAYIYRAPGHKTSSRTRRPSLSPPPADSRQHSLVEQWRKSRG